MDSFTQQIYSLLVVVAVVLVTTVIGPVPFLSCQGFQRGGGLIVRRVARTVPGFRAGQIVRRGVQDTGVGFGGQGFGAGTQRFGAHSLDCVTVCKPPDSFDAFNFNKLLC